MADRATFFENLETHSESFCAPAGWDPVQRALDILLVVAASPVWIPVLLAALMLKTLIDGRPLLFHHLRAGRNGEPLLLHKIRTTPPDFTPGPRDWTTADFPPRTASDAVCAGLISTSCRSCGTCSGPSSRWSGRGPRCPITQKLSASGCQVTRNGWQSGPA